MQTRVLRVSSCVHGVKEGCASHQGSKCLAYASRIAGLSKAVILGRVVCTCTVPLAGNGEVL